jgi:hypothetical protein
MKTIALLLRLVALRYQAYSLAVTIYGRDESMRLVRDPVTLARMDAAQRLTRGEHRRVCRQRDQLRNQLHQRREIVTYSTH